MDGSNGGKFLPASALLSSLNSEPTQYRCVACGKKYKAQNANFLATKSPLYRYNDGFTTMCKTCIDREYSEMYSLFNQNHRLCIERFCAMFDIYYNDRLYDAAISSAGGSSNLFALYIHKYLKSDAGLAGLTYKDTLSERVSEGSPSVVEPDNGSDVPSLETIKFFGEGFTNKQYAFLSEEYNEWTSRHPCETKAQETLYKQICIAELNVTLAQNGQIDLKVPDAQKALRDLMSSANVEPGKRGDGTIAGGAVFGTLIEEWEKTAPISEPKAEWADPDGVWTYVHWIVGHLARFFGSKQSDEVYQDELDKFTIQPPSYLDEDEV